MTVDTYVTGAALREIQEIRWDRAAAEALSAMPRMSRRGVAGSSSGVRGSGRYPHLTKIFNAGHRPRRAGDAG